MRLLCIDVGSGTQDILLLDTAQPVENAVQMVLPSPTRLVGQRVMAATSRRQSILLTGGIMGGGACGSAVKKHLAAGLEAYATPDAARSFHDDLDKVAFWGVQIVSDDEASRLQPDIIIRTGDVDLDLLERGLAHWDVTLDVDAIAVAVLDHGAAPRGISQRIFRFEQMECLLRGHNALESFIFTPDDIPAYLTRMQAVVRDLGQRAPAVLMDTGAAAVLGASLDPVVARHPHRLTVNLGNSHTLAFLMTDSRVAGVFEHHTSLLTLEKLEAHLGRLSRGELVMEEIWNEGGHGSLSLGRCENPFITVTGPRRALMTPSKLSPHFAAPFGNMMLAGCFGLARAVAAKLPRWSEELQKTLSLKDS